MYANPTAQLLPRTLLFTILEPSRIMRLLQFNNDGDLSLTEFFEGNIPKYAILSHGWGAEEVTFKDLTDGMSKDKAGYGKIQFCGDQARRDGLEYFWVDTCCLDKSSSAELSEAINSMFRWYQDATKCYVYLADVSTRTFDADDQSSERPWELAFRNSRWFTRGWTLQELLAPPSVEFFSHEGQRLGDKGTLAQQIHETTGIPVLALEGTPLSEFSVDERMSWFSNRRTTRGEDEAYSVLGLFDVHMPLLYGEGKANAFRRLLEEIARRPLLRPEKDLESNIDAGSETSSVLGDIESIFSDGGVSMSSKSSVEMNPVHVSGIREVARALLSRDGFKSLCTAAVSNVTPRKSRVHIRGFLKNYGQQLDREASSQLQHQAAKFVQEVAGRIADEIRWSITGFDDVSGPADTGVEKQNLEKWLSNVENGMSQVIPKSDDPDQLIDDGDESDDEPDVTAAFPSIDAVREFLLSSNAFATLNQALDHWMNVNKRPTTKERAVSVPEVGQNIDLEHAINEGALTDTPSSAAFDLPEKSISNSSRTEQQYLSRSRSQSVKTLISGLLDFWGVSFLAYDLLELLVPPVPIGFERFRWRCSCNTVLWGDFPVDDSDALNNLKQDLCRNISVVDNSRRDSHTKTRASQRSYGLPTDQTSASVKATNFSNSSSQIATGREEVAGSTSNGRFSPITEVNAPSNEIGTHLVSLTEVIVDKRESTYFEICTNVGNYAVGHFEIDISEACTDGELFEKIWDTYNQSRGFGIRRLFLRPRDVHFVMFSISNRRAAQYSAGIHKKPEEYPPDEELQQQRYHYFSPKIVMPGHVFIHFLHRARWNVWGEHADDTWLKRLPKKLNESILAAQAANASSDLVFGWGVHILDGPNHAVLGLFLAFGLMITFVISCLIVGIAKTQEQAFGVGQYFVAIVVALMSAMYFKLQDQ